jgi:quercetin dioxygenase-like cupin family protein
LSTPKQLISKDIEKLSRYEKAPTWFAHFLKSHRKKQGDTIRDLVERAKGLNRPEGLPFDESPDNHVFVNFERGVSRQFDIHNPEHLEYLAKVYNTDDPLLYTLFPEAVNLYVHLHDANDFKTITPDESIGRGYHFDIPLNRLKDERQSINRLIIEPGSDSPFHTHAGTEIVIAQTDNVIVELAIDLKVRNSIKIEMKDGDILHFKSENKHRLKHNPKGDCGNAEAIIIRSYKVE